ncbi:uncharacterized protein PRCAT00005045001 [Priceomyces carsonii]|uniref:uncharacterized protein n=1 Tax=Priceomyces carsonii TaxID=28549 RepID=UPI002EDAD0BE|nr:unnamed protein product [Priceomyces carsonii]
MITLSPVTFLVVSLIILFIFLAVNYAPLKVIRSQFLGSDWVPKKDLKKTYLNLSAEKIQRPIPLMISPEDVKTYDDRPWRPFRWPYHQTMSIFKLDINHWLDMDKHYWHYIQEKERIRLKFGQEDFNSLSSAYEDCVELMETVTDHMLTRYPLLFKLIDNKGDNGKVIKNLLTSETLDMSLPLKEHPLTYISKMAKEDFYVVKRNPEDDTHYLAAAAVPFPGGSFKICDILGRKLDVLHDRVPYYKEKLQKSMEKYMSKMKVADPVERASWHITWDHKLRVNNVYQIPKFKDDVEELMKSSEPKDFNVRVERQTLRRLPKSKAIIFTNHPVFYSIEEMKNEPMVPSLLRKILYEAPEDIIKYKKFDMFRDHLCEYLNRLIKSQLERGIIDKNDPVRTLPSYPFACWSKTDYSATSGWNNPSYPKQESNYTQKAREETYFGND